MNMSLATRTLAVLLLVVVLVADQRAEGLPYRRKRTSDHRLAELEAYLGLSKLKGQVITVPVGYGRVNLEELGRRRRSVRPYALRSVVDPSTSQDSGEESIGDLLQDVEKSRPYQWDAY